MQDIEQMVKYERRFTSIEGKLDVLIEQKEMITEIFKRLSLLEAADERRKGERGMITLIASAVGSAATFILTKVLQ